MENKVGFLSTVRGIDLLVRHAFTDWDVVFEKISERRYDSIDQRTFDDGVVIYQAFNSQVTGTLICCSVSHNFMYDGRADPFQNTDINLRYLSGPKLRFIQQMHYLKSTYGLSSKNLE